MIFAETLLPVTLLQQKSFCLIGVPVVIAPTYVFAAPDIEMWCHAAAALFVGLDYDGTLVPIAPRSEDARPSMTVLSRLSQLTQTPTVTVALVSGRSLAELRTLVPIPQMTYVGTHGLEISTPMGQMPPLVPQGVVSLVMARLRQDAESLVAGKVGFFIEDKRYAVALHYRLAPQEETDTTILQFLACVRRYQRQGAALEVLHGKMVVEVRPVGVNKGKALQSLLTVGLHRPFPLYIGDDVTDEDAFQSIRHLGGISIIVADPPPQHSAAHYYLHDPEEVVRFLTRLLCIRSPFVNRSSLTAPQ